MTITLNRMSKFSLATVVGSAIVLTVAVSSVAQAQNYSTRDSFNRAFANRAGAVDVLKRGQRAQNYRFQQRQRYYNRNTRRIFNGRGRTAQQLRQRGNMARQYRNNQRMRQMFNNRLAQPRGILKQRGYTRPHNRHVRFNTNPRGRGAGYRATRHTRHVRHNQHVRNTRHLRHTRHTRNVRHANRARNAAKAARFAKTARYAKYATGAGAVAALGGVDPISMGIHAVTRPKHFAKRAGYYARNPHKGVYQVGKNVVTNTRKIGCGIGNVFKKKRNRNRCR